MASFFEWDSSKHSVSVSAMDLEHQRLIGFMNTLHSLHERKADRTAVGKALADLANYTVRHFADEEAYMEKIGFPTLSTHRLVHKSLLERVGTFVADFEKTGQLSDSFFAFLKLWLTAHICTVDVKYGHHAKAA